MGSNIRHEGDIEHVLKLHEQRLKVLPSDQERDRAIAYGRMAVFDKRVANWIRPCALMKRF